MENTNNATASETRQVPFPQNSIKKSQSKNSWARCPTIPFFCKALKIGTLSSTTINWFGIVLCTFGRFISEWFIEGDLARFTLHGGCEGARIKHWKDLPVYFFKLIFKHFLKLQVSQLVWEKCINLPQTSHNSILHIYLPLFFQTLIGPALNKLGIYTEMNIFWLSACMDCMQKGFRAIKEQSQHNICLSILHILHNDSVLLFNLQYFTGDLPAIQRYAKGQYRRNV